jgi:hypothetical protein
MACGARPRSRARGEAVAERRRQRLGAVARHLEPAAPRRPVRRERRDDERPARPERGRRRVHVASAVLGVGQEVEDRPVVPHVVRLRRQVGVGDVRLTPLDFRRAGAEARPGPGEGGAGEVEHRDAPEAPREAGVDQGGVAAPHVDDRRVGAEAGSASSASERVGSGWYQLTSLDCRAPYTPSQWAFRSLASTSRASRPREAEPHAADDREYARFRRGTRLPAPVAGIP